MKAQKKKRDRIQKSKAGHPQNDQKAVASGKEEGQSDNSYGGMPISDFKKNLGCG
jgi:hypothetical protein